LRKRKEKNISLAGFQELIILAGNNVDVIATRTMTRQLAQNFALEAVLE